MSLSAVCLPWSEKGGMAQPSSTSDSRILCGLQDRAYIHQGMQHGAMHHGAPHGTSPGADSTGYMTSDTEVMMDISQAELQEVDSKDALPDIQVTSDCQDSKDGLGPRVARACAVCGDSAFGRNFGVASCESCKAFFRRNMHKDTLFGRCDNRCEVTVQSRTHCKRCRLKKCFEVGMKRELTRKMFGEKVRARESAPSSSTSTASDDISLDRRLVGLVPDERLFADLVQEVLDAFSVVDAAGWKGSPPGQLSDVDFVNLIEVPTRRIVKVSKNLPSFKSLATNDQVALLKGGIMELTWFISAMNFDPKRNSWIMDKANSQKTLSPKPLLQGRRELRELFILNAKFSSSILNIIQDDFVILKLILIICLFSSDRAGISDPDAIQRIQERYATALYQYIQAKHPLSPGLFAKAVQKLVDIRDISEKHTQMLMGLNVGQLRPLIVEVFDLPKDNDPLMNRMKQEPPS